MTYLKYGAPTSYFRCQVHFSGHENCNYYLDLHCIFVFFVNVTLYLFLSVCKFTALSFLKVKIYDVIPPPEWEVTETTITFVFSNRIDLFFFVCKLVQFSNPAQIFVIKQVTNNYCMKSFIFNEGTKRAQGGTLVWNRKSVITHWICTEFQFFFLF